MSDKFKLFGDDPIQKVDQVFKRKPCDRRMWNRGPWDTEKDFDEWIYAKGYKGRIARTHFSGSLCGYVGVPRSHRLFGVEYGDDRLDSVSVHGGLTFSDYMGNDDGKRDDDFWYFGFDCAHGGDAFPAKMPYSFGDGTEVYRDWDYVKAEVNDLYRSLERLA